MDEKDQFIVVNESGYAVESCESESKAVRLAKKHAKQSGSARVFKFHRSFEPKHEDVEETTGKE